MNNEVTEFYALTPHMKGCFISNMKLNFMTFYGKSQNACN